MTDNPVIVPSVVMVTPRALRMVIVSVTQARAGTASIFAEVSGGSDSTWNGF